MPNFCAVVGCGSRGDRDRNSFFRIPCIPSKGQPEMIALKTERRMKWILALRRKDLTETKLKYALICDRHFISGRPAATRDMYNLDWVPSQNMGYDADPVPQQHKSQRDNKDAIVCYLTPCISEKVQGDRIESEVLDQNDGSLPGIDFTSPQLIQRDLHSKQDNNKNAIICYVKPCVSGERTNCETIDQDEDSPQSINFACSEDIWADQHRKENKNTNAIICYLTPCISDKDQEERT